MAVAYGQQVGEPDTAPIDEAIVLATAPALGLVDADVVMVTIYDPAGF
jgi:hypothetical protein